MKGNSEKENEHGIHICPHFISLLRVEKAKKITVLQSRENEKQEMQ